MMMPANFSAISENEMTYVNGGAALEDILAPALTVSNWQTFNTNMVTLIGNHYVEGYVNNTLGKLFSGNYSVGSITKGYFGKLSNLYNTNNNPASDAWYDKAAAGALGVLNAGLDIVGNLAAVYNLATGTVDNAVSGDGFGFTVQTK